MAKPVTAPTIFASSATFTGASGVPAGLVGQPVRVTGPTSFYSFGFEPNDTFKTQFVNAVVGPLTEWAKWVYDGTNTAAATAHIVETVSSGRANIRLVHVGASPVEPYFPTAMMEIETEVGYQGLAITTVATSLHALKIDAASTGSPAMLVTQTGAGRPALDITGPGGAGVATILVNGGSGTGVKATVTGANNSALEGYATAGAFAAIYGEGAAIGVRGRATATDGSGGRFDTNGSADSTSEAVDARAFNNGVGVRIASVNGSAIETATSGTADSIVVTASGTGAAARFDPQSAPATDTAGQLWSLDVDTYIAQLMYCGNATGLAQAQRYVWGAETPLIAKYASDNSTQSVAQGSANFVLLSVTVNNPYAIPVPVRVQGRATFLPNPLGTIPLAACTVSLHDFTGATGIETDAFTFANSTHRTGFTLENVYTLPAATQTEIRLRVTVAAGTGGNAIDVSHCKLSVINADGKMT